MMFIFVSKSVHILSVWAFFTKCTMLLHMCFTIQGLSNFRVIYRPGFQLSQQISPLFEYEEKLSKYELNENCRSQSHISNVDALKIYQN